MVVDVVCVVCGIEVVILFLLVGMDDLVVEVVLEELIEFVVELEDLGDEMVVFVDEVLFFVEFVVEVEL